MAQGRPGRAKGHPKTGGRKAGTPNRRSQGVEAIAASIIEDEKYLANLKARSLDGTLPPAVETMLWHYRYGKPVEQERQNQALLIAMMELVFKYAGADEIKTILEAHAAATGGIRLAA